MLVPRFRAEESWDLSGDVDIWFMDGASQELVNKIGKELKQMIPNMHKHARSTYHIEGMVGKILNNMVSEGSLIMNGKTKKWVFLKEASNGKGRYSNNNIQKRR